MRRVGETHVCTGGGGEERGFHPPYGFLMSNEFIRLRTHNQKITVAARAIAERKTVGDLS